MATLTTFSAPILLGGSLALVGCKLAWGMPQLAWWQIFVPGTHTRLSARFSERAERASSMVADTWQRLGGSVFREHAHSDAGDLLALQERRDGPPQGRTGRLRRPGPHPLRGR